MTDSRIQSYGQEIRKTLVLAGPVVASMLAQNANGFVDTAMVGRLGPEPLAAVALGSSVFFFILLVCMGVILAVEPMVAQAHGAGRPDAVERSVRQGLRIGLVLGIPAFLLIWNVAPILRLSGQDERAVVDAQAYLRAVAFGAFPMLWFTALRGFVEGLGRPLPVTIITAVGVGVNVVGNYVLMYGKLGLPAFGIVGAGISTSIVLWFLFLSLTVFVRQHRELRRYELFRHLTRPDWPYLKELVHVGWPIGISFGLESGLFSVTALLVGALSTAALAAHQIALQSAAFTFMVPLGIGVATSVRVGQAAGRGDAHEVRRAGFTGISLAALFMICSAVTFWTVPERVVGLYLDTGDPANAAVMRLAVLLLGIAAVFQIFDGIQASAGGALRGLKDTRAPMLIGFLSYWVIGLTTGCLLGFVLDWGTVGLWWGLVLGLLSASVLLTLRFRRFSSLATPLPSADPEQITLPAATAPEV